MQISMKVDADLHETFKILKDRYKTRRVSDAIRAFIADHDSAVIERGTQIAIIRNLTEDDEKSPDGGAGQGE